MAASTTISFLLSSVLSVLIFSAMQMQKNWLASTQVNTMIGGYIGSWLFILSLTAINNLETIVLGKGFQSRLFPEIFLCLLGSMFASSMIHRVCVTVCFIFSCISLYFINRLSQKYHNATVSVETLIVKKKKK